jgi:hypothetical protein
MSDLLDIITSEETNQSGKLYINGSGESAIISYKNS